LLFLGIAVIVWSIYSSYNVFTGRDLPPSVFEIEETESVPEEDMDQMDQLIKEKLGEIISAGEITKILNLTTWLMLAGILIFGGSKISLIGVKLIKE